MRQHYCRCHIWQKDLGKRRRLEMCLSHCLLDLAVSCLNQLHRLWCLGVDGSRDAWLLQAWSASWQMLKHWPTIQVRCYHCYAHQWHEDCSAFADEQILWTLLMLGVTLGLLHQDLRTLLSVQPGCKSLLHTYLVLNEQVQTLCRHRQVNMYLQQCFLLDKL